MNNLISRDGYKIGDRVMVIKEGASNYGRIAEVIGFHLNFHIIYVAYSNGSFGDSRAEDWRTEYKKTYCRCDCHQ